MGSMIPAFPQNDSGTSWWSLKFLVAAIMIFMLIHSPTISYLFFVHFFYSRGRNHLQGSQSQKHTVFDPQYNKDICEKSRSRLSLSRVKLILLYGRFSRNALQYNEAQCTLAIQFTIEQSDLVDKSTYHIISLYLFFSSQVLLLLFSLCPICCLLWFHTATNGDKETPLRRFQWYSQSQPHPQ